jgi:hypothetical protein
VLAQGGPDADAPAHRDEHRRQLPDNASGETKYADVRFKETYKGDKWDGARADAPLADSVVSVRLDPGEEREVELVWDSSGYA